MRQATLTDFNSNEHDLTDLLYDKDHAKIIGKGKEADINLTDGLTWFQRLNHETVSISEKHARIYFSEESLVIDNKQGHSNTRIKRGEIFYTLKGKDKLQDGDKLYLGSSQTPLIYRIK